MSNIEAIETALLAKVTARIATVTTQRGARFIEDIPATSIPYAFTASPVISSETVDFEQRTRRTGVNVVIVWRRTLASGGAATARTAAIADFEAIETAIDETDPTLAGTVKAARVESFFLDENPETNVFVGVMGIIVEERR